EEPAAQPKGCMSVTLHLRLRAPVLYSTVSGPFFVHLSSHGDLRHHSWPASLTPSRSASPQEMEPSCRYDGEGAEKARRPSSPSAQSLWLSLTEGIRCRTMYRRLSLVHTDGNARRRWIVCQPVPWKTAR